MEYKKVERIVKGYANHWRLKILALLEKHADLSVDQITENLDANFITISVHLRRLFDAGLITKNYKGRFVLHALTKRGKEVLSFCRMLK